jgi:NADPH-dependent curcumin reductase CurA
MTRITLAALGAASLLMCSTAAFAQGAAANGPSTATGQAGAMGSMTCQQMMDKASPMMGSMSADKKAMAMKEMDAAKMAMANKDEAGCQSHMKMAMPSGM